MILQYYECDIGCEYTSFEEDLKLYCDLYADFYIENNACGVFFEALKSISESIIGCSDDFYYYEDFFRPVQLIIYYLGKLILSSGDNLKDKIYDWLIGFCSKNENDDFVVEYFHPFLEGKKISNSDRQYTNYKDFNKVVSANRRK